MSHMPAGSSVQFSSILIYFSSPIPFFLFSFSPWFYFLHWQSQNFWFSFRNRNHQMVSQVDLYKSVRIICQYVERCGETAGNSQTTWADSEKYLVRIFRCYWLRLYSGSLNSFRAPQRSSTRAGRSPRSVMTRTIRATGPAPGNTEIILVVCISGCCEVKIAFIIAQ